MKPKQTHDYLRNYILNGSEILSILFELQNGQINKAGNSLKYIPQLIQCHLIFKPSFHYRFVISSIINFSFRRLSLIETCSRKHDVLRIGF